jgi:aspartate/methionine/tyrosine aminotransferase
VRVGCDRRRPNLWSNSDDRLLDEAGVAVLPGTAFGEYGENYLRFSYADSVDNFRRALDAFTALVSR